MAGGSDARKVAAEYFRQMCESGEREVYLPPENARAVRGDARPQERFAAAGRGAPKKADAKPAGGKAPAARTATTTKAAATPTGPGRPATEAPDVEVIRVKLAFSHDSTTGDMFAAGSGLEKCATLEDVEAAMSGCTKCELADGRTNIVFGAGDPNARLLFVGEAPGRDEDIQGVPFVGRAGQLLNKILDAAEIAREDVYIANIIKCRPPNNRTPLTNEIEACIPYLGRQVALIAPKIICTLGLPATQTLLGIRGSMGSLRGKMYVDGDVKVIPTYHPAAALRDPKYKRPIWDDFLLIKREYQRQ